MKKAVLEIREYDTISCNDNYKGECAYLPPIAFRELVNFIHAYSDSDETEADILEFMKIGYKHKSDIITVKNFVGLIEFKAGYQIQILPKIDFFNDVDNTTAATKKVFVRMIRTMRDFEGKAFNDAALNTDRMNLYEIFVHMYLNAVWTLIKRGLKSGYIRQEENLNFYKGKLLVREQLRRNLVHAERFYVSYDEYQLNRAENRLIKSTLLKLERMSESEKNKKEIRRLLMAFELVKPSRNYNKDFAKVALDRSMKDYEILMRWSEIFLLNKSFTPFSGNADAKAILFPMEKVFESYVAKHIRKNFTEAKWQVSLQDYGYYLFDAPQRFALKPDIVVTTDNGHKIIFDTKWKKLNNNPNGNYGLSQADMYQMYAYAKKYRTPDVWLIFPKTYETYDCRDISYQSDDNVNVRIFFVDVANIEESVQSLQEEILKG